jgi:hypothetical protein
MVFLLAAFVFSLAVRAQETKKYNNRMALGGAIETGIPYYRLPEGSPYVPLLFCADYRLPLLHAKKFFNMAFDFVPQAGFIAARNAALEAGLNVRFGLCFSFRESSMIRLQAGTGPHYFGYETARQAHGFIFADNFLFQYSRLLPSHKIEIRIIAGFRHISNLNIHLPNKGINNVMAGIGFGKVW